MASSRTHKGHGGKGLALFCYLNYNIATINKQYACPLVLIDLGAVFMPICRRAVGIFSTGGTNMTLAEIYSALETKENGN